MNKVPYAGKEIHIRLPRTKSGEGRRPRKYNKPSGEVLVNRQCLNCRKSFELNSNHRLCESCRAMATKINSYI